MKPFNSIKFFLLLIAFSIFVSGQEKKEKHILLDVSVFNRENEIVRDLKQENFLLYEDNKPLEISYFNSENSPISVGFLIDVSQSMGSSADLCREGILNFLEKSDPKNEYFVAAFSRKVNLLSDFTNVSETAKIVSANPYFAEKQKSGETVLSEAINFGIENLSKSKNRRKVLFVFWDNYDDYSLDNYKRLKKSVREKNIAVYPVGCRSVQTRSVTNFNLEKLAEISGGKLIEYQAETIIAYRSKLYSSKDFFMHKFFRLAEQFQSQYVIGFKPNQESKDNKWRKIEIKLNIQKELKKQVGMTSVLHRMSDAVTNAQF